MARFSRLEVLTETFRVSMIPIFYDASVDKGKRVISVCAGAGATVFEFVNRGDNAFVVFSELVSHFALAEPSVILGAGSIIEASSASLFIDCGANFIVGPTFNPDVARVCNRRKIAYIPGCASASEISQAEESGVELVKTFFRDPVTGHATIKVLRGPMPWTRIMQSGCVDLTPESVSGWFDSGVSAIGLGSALFGSNFTSSEDYEALAARTTRALELVHQAKGGSVFQGVDHVSLHPSANSTAEKLADWYLDLFNLSLPEGNGGLSLECSALSSTELVGESVYPQYDIAIRVTNFASAVSVVEEKGMELECIVDTPSKKLALLKQRDPAGNRVLMMWRLPAECTTLSGLALAGCFPMNALPKGF